ncbi:hypothetical protein HK102_001185 [Quaeritorhiza haematococci]|nr:hypothetical protein HK102_001185 [Quaeritorhiza haematococci]
MTGRGICIPECEGGSTVGAPEDSNVSAVACSRRNAESTAMNKDTVGERMDINDFETVLGGDEIPHSGSKGKSVASLLSRDLRDEVASELPESRPTKPVGAFWQTKHDSRSTPAVSSCVCDFFGKV